MADASARAAVWLSCCSSKSPVILTTRSAPLATHVKSISSTSPLATVNTVTAPPCNSLSWSASSNALSSHSFILNLSASRSRPVPSLLISNSSTRSGTCFTGTMMFILQYSFYRAYLAAHRFIDQFNDVAYNQFAFVARGLHRIFETRYFIGAADRQHIRARADCFTHAPFGKALGDMGARETVEPHAAAAAAAAIAVRFAALHLSQFNARDRLQQATGRFILAVVPPQVAGIVEGDAVR